MHDGNGGMSLAIEAMNIRSAAETGLNPNNLMKLALKIFYVRGTDGARQLSDQIKLHIAVTKELLETAKDQNLVEILGTSSHETYSDFHYGLTGKGREWAVDALAQNQYVGPAPVTLADYRQRVLAQSVTREQADPDLLHQRLSGLVVPDTLERRLGPAVNSGRSLLLYGAPGNGKTTIAEAAAKMFEGSIDVPYAIEVEGEIIKVFDPLYHNETGHGDGTEAGESGREAAFSDRRWVRCHRPVIIVGGELKLSMLDLHFGAVSRFYEAPLQLKANGGTFIIDDLGRQFVSPTELLNRWIIPMEKRIDYLSLQSGTTFPVPFDNLLIFSTNLEPTDLMDPAFLRRIPYKVEVSYPTEEEFRLVFENVCRANDLVPDDDLVSFAIRQIISVQRQPLSFYQPKFIVDQVIAASRFHGRIAEFTRELVEEAICNISARTTEQPHSDDTEDGMQGAPSSRQDAHLTS